jgi:hypothetical protein
MVVQKVLWQDLSPDVRAFLAQVKGGTRVLVSGADGQPQFGVVGLQVASPRQRAAAQKRLDRIRRKTGAMMKRTGKTDDELDRILQEEDAG